MSIAVPDVATRRISTLADLPFQIAERFPDRVVLRQCEIGFPDVPRGNCEWDASPPAMRKLKESVRACLGAGPPEHRLSMN